MRAASDIRSRRQRSLLALLAGAAGLACTVAVALPASGAADEPVVLPAAPSGESAPPAEGSGPAATTTAPAPAQPSAPTATQPASPQVQVQHSQGVSPSSGAGSHAKPGAAKEGETGAAGTEAGLKLGKPAVSPSTLTPALPLNLGSLTGVPSFFIESFRVPPFLLPIFEAAGAAYGIPWQVLAAINEVETDYGRDLSVSSAGAEGWMQFLPSSWSTYGVDANGDGFADPYNPADAIFAAARYLHAAGGEHEIRSAIFAYNHSQAYVASVMLRAQLLGGTPSELLGAITGLTEARFPVHALAHFDDVFPTAPAHGNHPGKPIVGTTIYSQPGAPVIAVQDGEVAQIGRSAALGRFVVLRDAFGNTYTYGHLGDVAPQYPVLAPHVNSTPSPQVTPSAANEPAPTGPATAGAQPRSPLSEAGTASGLALGSAAGLEAAPSASAPPAATTPAPPAQVRSFTAGSNDVFLHPLRGGVQVIAGTVLGHVGAASRSAAGTADIIFQIRPAGIGAPLIDPKPILDGWVALESSSIFHARGENPFLATSPTVGQVLLESKQQLEHQVLRDGGISLGHCGRAAVSAGAVDKRVLAMLEYLSVSGLRPTTAGLRCPTGAAAVSAANAPAGGGAEAIDIVAVNGVPVAGHQTPGSPADQTVRRLLMLQGLQRPRRIVSEMSYPHSVGATTSAKAADAIKVSFAARGHALAAGALGAGLSPTEWIKLVARLGEIPDPTVSRAPSSAAVKVQPANKEATSGHH